MRLLFSIIVPVHNSEKTIKRCVNSLLMQGDVRTQIILVENGSTDNSLYVCKEIVNKKIRNIELYIADKSGVSNARNIGLKHAKGDIICFCDSDDYFEENVLNMIENEFSSREIDMVISGFTTLSEEKYQRIACKKKEIVSKTRFIEYLMCYRPIMGSVWNKFYRFKLIKDGVAFPESLHYMEDTYFNFLVAEYNNELRVSILKDNTYYYIRSSESVTGSNNKMFDDNCYLLSNRTRNMLLNVVAQNEIEKEFVRDALCQESILALKKYHKTINTNAYNLLFEEVKNNYSIFLKRFFKFNIKEKVKLLVFSLALFVKGRK